MPATRICATLPLTAPKPKNTAATADPSRKVASVPRRPHFSISQAEAARKWHVDVSTVIGIRRTVKDAALAALAVQRGVAGDEAVGYATVADDPSAAPIGDAADAGLVALGGVPC